SFNVKGGRCEACQGDGVRAIGMHFLPDVYVSCETCRGRRYNRETLEILYHGRTVADVLDMTVAEAQPVLSAHPRLNRLLLTLIDVGLGYIHLGQSAATLSGGEAQRVKLARELGRRETGRTLYILDERTTYLVSHSLGAMPRAARQRLQDYADTWATRGVRAWAEGWWRMPISVGDQVGRIIGAPPGSVVMHQNVSLCQALVLSCFDFSGRRNKIVYEELNFPSVMYVYEAHRALGARVMTVPSEDGITVPLERFLEAIDDETLLVPLSHVGFTSGFVQDVPAIVRRAHDVGALVVADLYQSAGTVPVDVT